MTTDWRKKLEFHYGFVLEPELIREIESCAVYRTYGPGEIIMDLGDSITAMPLLLDGALKVLREDDSGEELLIYFLEKGDTCAMTFSCCMGKSKSEVRAVAENDTELLMIPADRMEDWMGVYPGWRRFVLDNYHTRMMELMETVDALAFMRMDERLLRHLQDKAKVTSDATIGTTHQEIAQDLHTSRVVVSRLLKKLEKEGRIAMERNRIHVLEL